jgi:hypothetical protein
MGAKALGWQALIRRELGTRIAWHSSVAVEVGRNFPGRDRVQFLFFFAVYSHRATGRAESDDLPRQSRTCALYLA